jgi:O-antigen ligase
MSERRPGWRAPVALTLMLLFALTILATGSRAGLIFGLIGLAAGLLLSQRGLKRMMRHYHKWAFPALMAGIVAVVMIFVLISIAADRAVSIQRVLVVDQAQDMRTRGLPTVLQMINTYFPAGTGFGAFDPMFRIHEPFQLLKLTYFNHAHNDWLEIVLDGGLPGAVLLAGAVLWWLWRSAKLWAEGAAPSLALARLGSAMLLLVMIASIFDYPARTPTIMALIVIAATWLSSATTARAEAALPESGHHL